MPMNKIVGPHQSLHTRDIAALEIQNMFLAELYIFDIETEMCTTDGQHIVNHFLQNGPVEESLHHSDTIVSYPIVLVQSKNCNGFADLVAHFFFEQKDCSGLGLFLVSS
jgi:hypothetical protein